MYAIEIAVRDRDRSAIRNIVEQLDSDDPAVRCLAISALTRLTGESFGYHDNDPPALRRLAIQKWVEAVNSNTIPVPSSGSSRGHDDAALGNRAVHA